MFQKNKVNFSRSLVFAMVLVNLLSKRAAYAFHPGRILYSSKGSNIRLRNSPFMSTTAAAVKVLVPIADGSEEIESVTVIDTLVRAGASVTVASVMPNLQVTCSRGVKLVADKLITECLNEEWDCIACPGGLPGADHLRDSQPLTELLKKQAGSGKLTSAICASPAVVLQTHGILDGLRATCYPVERFTGAIPQYSGDSPVVVDKNVVTSQGPGTSFVFALTLVEQLFGKPKAQEIAKQLLIEY